MIRKINTRNIIEVLCIRNIVDEFADAFVEFCENKGWLFCGATAPSED